MLPHSDRWWGIAGVLVFAFQKRISEDRKTILIILPHVFCFLLALFDYLCKQARKHYAEYGYDQVSVHFFQNPAVLSVSRVMIHRCTIFKEHECHCFLSFLLYKCRLIMEWGFSTCYPFFLFRLLCSNTWYSIRLMIKDSSNKRCKLYMRIMLYLWGLNVPTHLEKI